MGRLRLIGQATEPNIDTVAYLPVVDQTGHTVSSKNNYERLSKVYKGDRPELHIAFMRSPCVPADEGESDA